MLGLSGCLRSLTRKVMAGGYDRRVDNESGELVIGSPTAWPSRRPGAEGSMFAEEVAGAHNGPPLGIHERIRWRLPGGLLRCFAVVV